MSRRSRWGDRERGEVIAQRYRLDRVLGEGGMGTVYRATHLTLHTPVAIKMMHATYSSQEKYRQRFTREARVNSLLKHPHAVQVYDFGEHEGSLYLAMEFLSGKPLRQQIRRGSLPEMERVIQYGIELADALAAAHLLKLIHRDLKPDNIMIEESPEGEQRLVVVDFGLAFMEATPSELGRLTTVGLISGTPQYMAPEQARGVDITPAVDVYAMGCLLYELATGRAPFMGRSAMDILNKHLFVTPPSPRALCPERAVPPALDALIMACLQKELTQRPTAAQVKARLEALRDSEPQAEEPRGASVLVSREERAVSAMTRTAPRRPSFRRVEEGEAARPVIALECWPQEHPMRMALEANGYHCQELQGEEIAPEAALVLAPRVTLERAQRLCQRADARPVLVTSLAGDMELASALLRAGVQEVIIEPVRVEDLLRKVSRALRKSRRGRA